MSCLKKNAEKTIREVDWDANDKTRQLGNVALTDGGGSLACNAGETLIGSKCYLACNSGYSPDSAGTNCVQDCASGETSTATTCTKPQIDDSQFDCGFGCAGTFVTCSPFNGRSYHCIDDGYRFPVAQCHCRSDAVTYTRATATRNWQCPAGTYASLGSCITCSPGSYQSSEAQSSCVACSTGTYTSSSGASTYSTCSAGSYTPSLLELEFSFDLGSLDGSFLTNGGTLAFGATLYNAPVLSTTDVKVGTGSIQLSAASSQYVALPSFITGSTGLSFACWFKSNSNGVWARIVDIGNGQANDNIIMGINGNGLFLSVYSGSSAANQPLNVIPSVNDNVWRHVVWTLDPTGIWTVYLNGVVTWQVTGYAYPADITRSSNFLGKSNWPTDPYFSGAFDEFRMYNRVLTSSDAQLVYSGDATFSTAYGAAACIESTASPTLDPTPDPTLDPTPSPSSLIPSTVAPSSTIPSFRPTPVPSTNVPSTKPTNIPTNVPSRPSFRPTVRSTVKPSSSPTSKTPTSTPTIVPSRPTVVPSSKSTANPSSSSTKVPSSTPTNRPTVVPSRPTVPPTVKPISSPSNVPTTNPTNLSPRPTVPPTVTSTTKPSSSPSKVPSTTSIKPTGAPSPPITLSLTPTKPSSSPTTTSTTPINRPTTIKPTATP